jgi:MYXO-CTERM domain-containing protein
MRSCDLVGLLVLVGLVAAPELARATPNFPSKLESELGLVAPPACGLCHAGSPGRGNVETPFGKALRARGLVAYDEASLGRALEALTAAQLDSDGDGVPDIDELKSGSDPNAAGATITPEYGCSVHAPVGESAWLVALTLAAIARRRRRR